MDDLKEALLSSPITSLTRRVRRNLIFASITLVLVVKGKMVPTKIEPLGIEIPESNIDLLPQIIWLITLYYLVKFFIFSQMDGRLNIYKAYKLEAYEFDASREWKDLMQEMSLRSKSLIRKYGLGAYIWSFARSGIDIFLPTIVALYALISPFLE